MLPISSAFPVKGVQPVTWTIIGLCALVAMIQFVDTGPTADFTYMLYGAHPALVVFDFLPWNADSTSIAAAPASRGNPIRPSFSKLFANPVTDGLHA